jgi:hypothetical protein
MQTTFCWHYCTVSTICISLGFVKNFNWKYLGFYSRHTIFIAPKTFTFKLHVSTSVGRLQLTPISKTKFHYAKRSQYNKTYALCILSCFTLKTEITWGRPTMVEIWNLYVNVCDKIKIAGSTERHLLPTWYLWFRATSSTCFKRYYCSSSGASKLYFYSFWWYVRQLKFTSVQASVICN